MKWYKDETEKCKLYRLSSSIHGLFYSLSTEEKKHYFLRSRGDKVANKAVRICSNKQETKNYLENGGVPVPQGKVFNISNVDEMVEYAEEIGFPIIIKPVGGSMGRGVFTNLNSKEQLIDAIKTAEETYKSTFKYKNYFVEKHYAGKEYRLYVVGDKVIGATYRIPANVTGDGKSTIQKLIKLKNQKRKEIPYLGSKPIKLDNGVSHYLKKYGYDKNTILDDGETIYLRENSNITTGGDPIDATDELTPEIKQIAVDALKALPSIPHAGVDIIVNPVNPREGVVLEVNATAEIGLHVFPMKGQARDIPSAIIDYYFPETIGKQKSNFYFDYTSLLEPLRTWSADEITVTKPPFDEVFGKKYIVTGKVYKVGYMTWIRRHALKEGLIGYSTQITKDKVEIVVMSNNYEKLNKFRRYIEKGSRRSVINSIEEENYDVSKKDTHRIGFEINSNI